MSSPPQAEYTSQVVISCEIAIYYTGDRQADFLKFLILVKLLNRERDRTGAEQNSTVTFNSSINSRNPRIDPLQQAL